MADLNDASAARAEGARARVKYVADTWFDAYTGTMTDLVDSGVAPADMFPGQQGRGKTSAAYYGGSPVPRGSNPKHDEQYLQIQRSGPRRFVVRVGLRADEGSRRHAAHLAEWGRKCEASGRAVQAGETAPSAGNPMDRNGRLFAAPIIEHGELSRPSTQSMLKRMISETSEERWRFASSFTNPGSKYEAQAFNDMLTAVSEVEAWVLVENVRKGVRHV